MAMTPAERQQRYREKRANEGKFPVTVFLTKKDWQAGYDAGKAGQENHPPTGCDQLSWYSGFIEGKAKRNTQ